MMCGYSTSEADVTRLMDGDKANLVVTDPPYNVSYESADGKKIQNDSMADGQFYEFLLAAFPNRVVNLHPALLPSFTGAHAIDDAFARGVKVTGVTVHFANEIYDNGPIIAQRALAVEEGWDVDTLEKHIHAIEHVLYPEVVQMLADGRVHVLESGKVAIDPAR